MDTVATDTPSAAAIALRLVAGRDDAMDGPERLIKRLIRISEARPAVESFAGEMRRKAGHKG
ncbi:hypothetical protein AGRO_4703 [Agrobacterium sp. ATCC 31749]|nr:hypothetical protein AGRO_4703 [Agrobacterium sp. ATCC 31749]